MNCSDQPQPAGGTATIIAADLVHSSQDTTRILYLTSQIAVDLFTSHNTTGTREREEERTPSPLYVRHRQKLYAGTSVIRRDTSIPGLVTSAYKRGTPETGDQHPPAVV